jgi:NitT/TauT family transport system permease protein
VRAAPAVALAVRAGIRNLPPLMGQAARTLGASGWRLGWHVLLPASLPACLMGMRQGWAFAWRTLMAAELLSQSIAPGLGGVLKQGQANRDLALMTGTIFVILAVSVLADRTLFSPLERQVSRRWGTA